MADTQYYCASCARAAGHLDGMVSSSLLSTQYQQGKVAKHTGNPAAYNLTSLFTDKSLAAYEGYFVSASASGTLEIDSAGRKNLVVYAGPKAGALFISGSFQLDQDSIKIVLFDDAGRVHAFPTGSSGTGSAQCSSCGNPTPV
jgi:hypothetical protein